MSRYLVLIHKVLEDGTEIEIANCLDNPWYVAPMLKNLAKQMHESPPVVNYEGQAAMCPSCQLGLTTICDCQIKAA